MPGRSVSWLVAGGVVGLCLCGMAAAENSAGSPRRAGARLRGRLVVFSHPPTDLANVSSVIPLGNLGPGSGHVLAVDHMYVNYPALGSGEAYPVYAMADGTLVMVRQGVTGDGSTPDYELYLSHTPQVTSYVIHVHQLSPRLNDYLAGVPEAAWIRLGGVDRIVLPGQLGATEPLLMTAGERLGDTRSIGSTSWDVGVIDTSRRVYLEGRGALRYPTFGDYLQALGVDAEPPMAGHFTINAACFTDYLSDELRDAWAALLASTPPGCGRAGWDLPGRLRGAWFNPAVDVAWPPPLFELESAALSVIPDNLAPTSRVQIGIASGSPFAALDPGGSHPQLRRPFKVAMDQAPGARVNPDPSRVSPGSGTVCYDLPYDDGGGIRYNSIRFRMLSGRSVAIKFDPEPSLEPRCGSTALGEPDSTWTTVYVR